MRSLSSVFFVAGLVAFAPTASAQALRVGIERAFGFAYASNTASSSTTVGATTVTRETNSTTTTLNLFGAGFTSASSGAALVYGPPPPRLAVDYELANHLTVGAAAYFSWASYAVEGLTSSVSSTGFGLAPRVGFALALGDRFAFWPRAGLSFGYASTTPENPSSGRTTTSSYLTLTLNVEPTLVYMPAAHFGFTAMVFGDIPLVGNVTTRTVVTTGATTVETTLESTYKQVVFGLQFGIMGRF